MQYAFINGASRGLGRALVEVLLQGGYSVFAGVLKSEVNLLADVQKVSGDKLMVLEMDVTKEDDVKNAAVEVSRRTNALHLAVNNAGVLYGSAENPDNPMDIDMAQLAESMDVNVYGGMRVLKHFFPLMKQAAKESNPTVINVTSEAGSVINAAPCYDPYCISKTAMNMVSNKMKLLLHPHGIRVFAVHPGRMKTDMSAGNGEITPGESAAGILKIVENTIHVSDDEKFIDYLGQTMTL